MVTLYHRCAQRHGLTSGPDASQAMRENARGVAFGANRWQTLCQQRQQRTRPLERSYPARSSSAGRRVVRRKQGRMAGDIEQRQQSVGPTQECHCHGQGSRPMYQQRAKGNVSVRGAELLFGFAH
jgi:hypothetical protein